MDFQFHVDDADKDVSFLVSQVLWNGVSIGRSLPTWLELDQESGRLFGIPPASEIGYSYNISITATDGFAFALDCFAFKVHAPPDDASLLSLSALP